MVIFLHCYGCPCSTSRGWEEESDARGAVLVKPCGDDLGGVPSWNAGACCGDAVRDNRDDKGFIQAVVREVLATSSRPWIDPERAYLTGFSNGGFMTSVLARTSTLFAAAAPVSGFEYTHDDTPARPGGVRLQVQTPFIFASIGWSGGINFVIKSQPYVRVTLQGAPWAAGQPRVDSRLLRRPTVLLLDQLG